MKVPCIRRASFVATAVIAITSDAVSAQRPGSVAIATTQYFAFHSDLATNINDALIAGGAARRAKKAELFNADPEKTCFDALPPAERAGWNRAVDYYAEILSPVQDTAREQVLPRLELAGVVTKDGLTDPAERRLIEITAAFRGAATPAYERCRWPAQDAANRRWIDNLLPLLARYEKALGERLAELFATAWAGLPFRVDVVEIVSFAGANSINLRPPGLHIQVSSSDANHKGRAALETVFHEASHFLTGFNAPLPTALAAAARDAGGGLRGDLTHPVQFFMAGEAVRRVLQSPGELPYTPFLYSLNLFSPEFREAVKQTWPAYMDGKRTMQEAARDLVRALGNK